MPAITSALVVGGGIGGLTMAVALRRQGIAVDLVEKNTNHSVYGVGIIQPNNTLRALDSIGLADECVARGGAFPGWRIFDQAGGHLMDASSAGHAAPHLPPINGITRPILQSVLLGSARGLGAQLAVGVTVKSWTDKGDAVDITLSDGRHGCYDIVIAADGLYSQFREELFPQMPPPTYSGQSVWRHNFPRPADVEWGELYYGATTKVGLVPMSPTLMYMLVVTQEPGNSRMAREGLAAALRERIAEYGGPIPALRDQIVEDDAIVYRPMEHLLLPAPWWKGRIVLIGDAAHATTPHLAQGAAMAIEDAVLLGELLGRSGAALPDLLDEFMRRRFDRAAFVIESSRRIADWELESWAGIVNPDARPGELLGEATEKLMEAY